jgi:NAD(P)-dependent dehydrogenase (short-subunit alcohol dehydrogenase family)
MYNDIIWGIYMRERVAIISGVSQGIGSEIAKKLLGENYYVFGLTHSDCCMDALSQNPNFTYSYCDIRKEYDIQAACSLCLEKWEHIDCLINNAGVSDRNSLDRASIEQWNDTFSVNVTGAALLSKIVIEEMKSHSYGGNIIFISSLAGVLSWNNDASYQASKAALEALSRSIAVDYAKYNIRSNCIRPGLIDSSMFIDGLGNEKDTLINQFITRIPIGRLGKPIDVANVVAFLLSDKSAYITGSIITVDGGYSIYDE